MQGDGPRLTLSEAVSQATRSAGVTPLTSLSALQGDLERPELQEAYTQQVPHTLMIILIKKHFRAVRAALQRSFFVMSISKHALK